jgi:hypothetical protein
VGIAENYTSGFWSFVPSGSDPFYAAVDKSRVETSVIQKLAEFHEISIIE